MSCILGWLMRVYQSIIVDRHQWVSWTSTQPLGVLALGCVMCTVLVHALIHAAQRLACNCGLCSTDCVMQMQQTGLKPLKPTPNWPDSGQLTGASAHQATSLTSAEATQYSMQPPAPCILLLSSSWPTRIPRLPSHFLPPAIYMIQEPRGGVGPC